MGVSNQVSLFRPAKVLSWSLMVRCTVRSLGFRLGSLVGDFVKLG